MDTAYLHGVDTVEVEDAAGRPITTPASGIICLLGTAGQGPVNTPTLISGNPAQAVRIFGKFAGDGFTIPEALKGILDEGKAAIVVINVADPQKVAHQTTVANEAKTFDVLGALSLSKPYVSTVALGTSISGLATVGAATGGNNGVLTLPTGLTAITSLKSEDGVDTYVVTTDYTVAGNVVTFLTTKGPGPGGKVRAVYTATLVADTDYAVDAAVGKITRLPGGKILAGATVSASFTYVDPTKVTEADLIGGVDTDGKYVGAKAILGAKGRLAITPRILLAPHYTHQKPGPTVANGLVAALNVVAAQVRATTLVDDPDTTDEASLAHRQDWGTERVFMCGVWHTIAKPDANHPGIRPGSIMWAGVMAATDAEVGFWASPSNRLIKGITGTTRDIDFTMGDRTCRANYLNSNQIATTIREGGFRTWGSRTAAADPKYAFLHKCRIRDMIIDSIAAAHLWAVDRNITVNYLEEVVGGVQAYMRSLKTRDAIYGGDAWADADLNTVEAISDGEVYIDFDFSASSIAEKLTFRAHMHNGYVKEVVEKLVAASA